ncbi:peptidoglycan recognition protein family protein [Oceanobacillus neutriphilus]|uniref:N-acetylmuramoyl-L-alanine amidase n=1 Tax=Oceanobacillus neutriphilus TaxID=531815 RepID=A0ABQ2NZ86_9BACI|nr:N-acetylmuramoyl-L-alanine amidase [Oceanobacillus neutriphilus]GGP14221.1 N-acetylmuramoyl-L-alanine amidase BlyA [Oceanobacillus neutriphilus]
MATWRNDYIKKNQYSRPGLKLTNHAKGIIHYTANPGATAANHWNYFNNLSDRYASAHIFVDKSEAICIIPLDEVAYAANDGTYRGVPALKPNANYKSISVEMCQEPDGSFHPNTIARTEDVFVELCKMYGWDPIKDIVRHYDVTHKNCPAPWVSNPSEFIKFKKRVNDKLGGKKVSKPKKTQTGSKQIINSKANLSVDGKWGNSTTLALQKALGTPQDGFISKQPRNSVTQSLYGSTVQFGSGGSNVIVALQKKVGATADGKLGPGTIRLLQKALGTPQDGVLSRPSMVVKELQRKLNAGTF